MARLVNKQFNSPIGLYSEANIRDVIQRDSQILANGAVGVNFNNPSVGKPANLQNSAVLRMLEEEEHRQRTGQSPSDRPLKDQITWPPPEFEHRSQQRASFKDVVTPGLKRVAWPPPQEGEILLQPSQNQGGNQYSSPQSNNPVASQDSSRRYPLKPLDISNGSISNQGSSGSPSLGNQSPVAFRPATPRQWAPVHSPAAIQSPQPQFPSPVSHYQSPQAQYQAPQPQFQSPQPQYPSPQAQYQSPVPQYQSPQPQYQSPVPQYQSPQAQYQSQPQYQAPQAQYQPPQPQYQSPQPQYQPAQPQPQRYQPQNQFNQQSAPAQSQVPPQQYQQPVRQVEPPPSTITLRQQAPVSQAPPPVVTSQPATATLKGGKNLRGDLKWPPENVRAQMEQEQRQLVELARGPACKPRLHKKDYGPFFAQHALNSSYPGYKVPPGTQFYDHFPKGY